MNTLLTIGEVAEMLRVDDTTVRRWIRDGALEAVILPHVNERQAYRVKREVIDALLKTPVVPAKSEASKEGATDGRDLL